MDLVERDNLLPTTAEGLHEYCTIGREQLKARRSQISALKKVGAAETIKKAVLENAQNEADSLLDAEGKLGELLAAIEPVYEPPIVGSPKGTYDHTPKKKKTLPPKISKKESHIAQTIAKNQDIVKEVKAKAKKKGELPTRGDVIKAVKKKKKAEKIEELNTAPLPSIEGPFNVIVIDPPWKYKNRASDPTHRAANQYPDMTVDEIKALDVAGIAEDDCILWLWTTNAFLHDAFHVLEEWGFQHKTILTWEKTKMGLGDWLRGKTEHCLLAVQGKPVVNLTNETTIIHGPLREHSRKPDEFYELVRNLCPGSRVDWFAREGREGFIPIGNETTKFQGEV